jgi:hypothetical protein
VTVIAFDGRYVATDKMATVGVRLYTVTKLWRWGSKALTIDGDYGHGLAMVAWYKAGADPTKVPPKDDGNWANLNVFQYGRHPVIYEGKGLPSVVEEMLWASGSGGATALGAMAAGKNAREAVEIANEWCDGCGKGVDVVDLMELPCEPVRAVGVGERPSPRRTADVSGF